MSNFAHVTLQKAIFETLNNDSYLLSITTGVYENPAPVIAFPYIALGALAATDWSTKTTSGLQITVPIHSYSQTSKKEVIDILDRVFDLLQSGGLDLEGHELIAMRFEYNEIGLEPDGITYHGVIRFKAYTEAIAA